MLIYNSELHSICSTRLNYKTVSFQHINNLISDTLVNIFLNKKILPVPATNAYSHANSKMNTTIDSSGEPIWLKNVIRNFSFLSRQTLLQHYREHHLTLRQFIDQLCPLPTYKILSLKFVPQVSFFFFFLKKKKKKKKKNFFYSFFIIFFYILILKNKLK